MNIDALKDALRRANIDERFVSLDGSARDESLVLAFSSVPVSERASISIQRTQANRQNAVPRHDSEIRGQTVDVCKSSLILTGVIRFRFHRPRQGRGKRRSRHTPTGSKV